MKILIRNLILVIAVFAHFCEVNSSAPIHGPESSRPHSYTNDPNVEREIMNYMGRQIEVLVNKIGQRTPVRCTLLGTPHRGVPNLRIKQRQNFITRALIIDNVRYCVAYVTEDGEVLGVKVPPREGYQSYTGDPGRFNPDASKWYITYGGLDYEVLQNPDTGLQLDINLLPENRTPDNKYIARFRVDTIPVNFGGLRFKLYKRTRGTKGSRDNKIVGADLD